MHIAEVTVNLTGLILRGGEGKTSDMYVSIDAAVDRIERQFNKYKTRINRRIQGPKLGEMAPPLLPSGPKSPMALVLCVPKGLL